MENLIVMITSYIAGGAIGGLILGYYLCGKEYKAEIVKVKEDHKWELQKQEIHTKGLEHAVNMIKEAYDDCSKQLQEELDAHQETINRIQQVMGIVPEIWGQAITEPEDIKEDTTRDQLFKDIREGYTNC